MTLGCLDNCPSRQIAIEPCWVGAELVRDMRLDIPRREGDQATIFTWAGKAFGAIGLIGDYLAELHDEELAHLTRAVSKRRLEYAAWRCCMDAIEVE